MHFLLLMLPFYNLVEYITYGVHGVYCYFFSVAVVSNDIFSGFILMWPFITQYHWPTQFLFISSLFLIIKRSAFITYRNWQRYPTKKNF